MYYLSDGIYGSFNCLVFDHVKLVPKLLRRRGTFVYQGEEHETEKLFSSSLWGPTCDSIECISKSERLPLLEVGDCCFFSIWELTLSLLQPPSMACLFLVSITPTQNKMFREMMMVKGEEETTLSISFSFSFRLLFNSLSLSIHNH